MEITLSEATAKQTLPCDADPSKPFLDFAFRYEIGYTVHCPLKEFGGIETSIAAYLRVQPAGNSSTWFSEWYRVPGIPDDLRSRISLERDHNDIEFSGVVAVGEGDYALDLVVVDRQHRLFHRNWKTKVFAHGNETRAPISLAANTVADVAHPDWTRKDSAGPNLRRLTVLVDAAPIHASATRLHAWDRSFLTEALSSVLKRLPSNSVRVVAFNLDQQQLFETDEFGPQATHGFIQSLEKLELGKISYELLQQTHGACTMLLDMLKRERSAKEPADAIILLGPTNRLNERIPPDLIADHRCSGPPVFYLKYSPISPTRFRLPFASGMGMRGEDISSELANLEPGDNGEFPDIIQHAAALHDGVTINLHSPIDLADALRSIERRLHSGGLGSAE